MYATIMVPALGDGSDDAALGTGFAVGRLFGAHLDCVHVHPAPGSGIETMAAALPYGNIGDAYVRMVEDTDKQLSTRARAAFDAACAAQKPAEETDPENRGAFSVAWREFRGRTDLITQARYYDLTVTAGGPSDITGNLVLGCGRPVLLASTKAPANLAGTVAIAWKETPEAARAVTAAMPLLKKAERVVVIAANEGQGSEPTARTAARLASQLAWHGIDAQTRCVLTPVELAAEAVLGSTREAGADCLVMGAYGHSRTSEFVFGGFTRYVLHNDTLPLLLFH